MKWKDCECWQQTRERGSAAGDDSCPGSGFIPLLDRQQQWFAACVRIWLPDDGKGCHLSDHRWGARAEVHLLQSVCRQAGTGVAIVRACQFPYCATCSPVGRSFGAAPRKPEWAVGVSHAAAASPVTVPTLHVPYLIWSLLVSLQMVRL